MTNIMPTLRASDRRFFVVFPAVSLFLFQFGSAAAETPVGSPRGEALAETAEGIVTIPEPESAVIPAATEQSAWIVRIDEFFGRYLVAPFQKVLFFDLGGGWLGAKLPFIVVWLICGAIFFTLRMGFINIRAFRHAIHLTRGDYDKPEDAGEVSHFQALASALSATVGLGNIAGVAIAVGIGGPGAIFWLICAGLLGMSSKFAECSLGQIYRHVDRDGTVSGGAMHYLKRGLAELGLPRLGWVLGTVFALCCVIASVGGGCVFQVCQSFEAVKMQMNQYGVTTLETNPWIYGLVMVVLVAIVILGGIRRIAATAEKIVPLMCGIYVCAAIYILAVHAQDLPAAVVTIVQGAFGPDAVYGGFIGVLITGFQRAAFSNEAGIGSAPIAHAAAKTDEPISEGIVALLEPFIDTVVVCSMTGLVIVVTGVCDRTSPDLSPELLGYIEANKGTPLTAVAFGSVISFFPIILTVAVVLFAYSTMISWSYYGERCFSHLFGPKWSILYRLFFLVFVFLGSIVSATNILDFSDVMMFAMALPNIFGAVLLGGVVRSRLDDYWNRYKAGGLEPKQPTTVKPEE